MIRPTRAYLAGATAAAVLVFAVPTLSAQEIVDAALGQALRVTDSTHMAELVTQLQLTPAQEARLRQLSQAFEIRHEAALEQAQRMAEELRALEASGEMDADALIALSQKYGETLTALLPATQQFLRDVMQILTPEQQAKFRQMVGGLVPQ
ncbi:MAG: Spy/CpxP family protein refolding chaperone [Gemmatimonadales bacterium]